jgi:hypothetical protein
VAEECWAGDRSRGELRWRARPRLRCEECTGEETAAMTAGTRATTAGTGGAEPLGGPQRRQPRSEPGMSRLVQPKGASSPAYAPRRL